MEYGLYNATELMAGHLFMDKSAEPPEFGNNALQLYATRNNLNEILPYRCSALQSSSVYLKRDSICSSALFIYVRVS